MGCSWLLTSQGLKLSGQIALPHFGKGEGGSLGKPAAEKPRQSKGTTASQQKMAGVIIHQKEVGISHVHGLTSILLLVAWYLSPEGSAD